MPSHTPAQLGVAHKERLPVVPPCCVTRGCSFPRTGNFWEHPGHGAAPVGVTCNFPGETSCEGCTDHLQGRGALQNEFYLDSSICPLFCSSRLNFLFFFALCNFPCALGSQSGYSGASGTDDTCAKVIPAWREITELNSYLSFEKKMQIYLKIS